ncbi:MAG TPA: hypothetical protein VGP48_14845 [Stellaceae bacterium]|jgi:hypothetical protein|nr:hypothetical protein [Stellaceae bacterium]
MTKIARGGLIALILLTSAGIAMAQTGQSGSSSDPGEQFKSAGQNISAAANNVGEGIKQGAIHAWQAVKAGASAAADKFKESSSAASSQPGGGSH